MPIRATFWNVPHWAEIGQYLLGFLALIIFSLGFIRHVRHWRMGHSERRIDQLGKRFGIVVKQALFQAKTVEDRYAGVMHFSIFWGMFALVMGTALATVDWDVTHLFFGVQFLTGTIYVVYELVLDVLGLLLVLGLGMAVYRRYVEKPEKLIDTGNKRIGWDDAYVLLALVLIAISGYLVEGLRVAVVEPTWAQWSPVGKGIAFVFISLGDPTNQTLHLAIWIFHTLVAFLLIATVPFTKMFHVLAAPINIFFLSLEPAGRLSPARSSGSVGVQKWTDFSWKQILDFDTCIRCGRCQDDCPAYAANGLLSPKNIMISLHEHTWKGNNGRQIYNDAISIEELWECTSCIACVGVCPVFTDQLSSIIDMRRFLVYEGQIDSQLQDSLANLGRYGNSFGQSERARAKWTRGIEPKMKDARREPVEFLWFVGDYASYHSSCVDISHKTAKVFQHVGLDFGILYEAERNSGNDVRRVGEEGLFEMLMEDNISNIDSCDYQTLVTTDPHTLNTLKNEYAWEDGTSPVVLHYSELLDQLISSDELNLNGGLGYKVTFHDPCYLGRYNDTYDAPRRVIAATGCQLIEMEHNKDKSICCGAGGGRIWMEEGEVSERPSERRIREAMDIEDVECFVVACPKDVTMYRDAIKTVGVEDQLVVKDLIELVFEALELDYVDEVAKQD